MKRLFLFIAVATLGLTTSCSSDDNKGGNESGNSVLKVTIDGTPKTFNSIDVFEHTYTEYYTILTVVAHIGNNSDERITFKVVKGDLEDGIWDFTYQKNGVEYWENQSSLLGELEINSNNRLKGTFTGFVYGDTNNVYLTNGSFDISY